MRKTGIFFGIALLIVSFLLILYEIGGAGDSAKIPGATVLSEGSLERVPPSTSEEMSQLLKGSGRFVSQEVNEKGDFLLMVKDEMGAQKHYLIPKGLTIEKEEEEILPDALQAGDILDIDYLRSEIDERIVTHLSVIIPITEKEIQIEAPALGLSSEKIP